MSHAVTRLATICDQLLVALANFALTVSVGRAFGAEEVAAYGIGLSAGLLIQALQRHAIIIPLMLQPPARVRRWRGGIFAQHSLVLAAGLACGGVGLLLELFAGLPRFGCLIIAASSVSLFVYAEMEFARAILVKLDKPFLLFASAVWYAAVCVGLTVAALHHLVTFEGVLALLAAGMGVHALALFTLARGYSLLIGLHLLAVDSRRYGGWAMVAALTWSGYNHLPLFVLGALAPPIHAAAFVATRSLLQPQYLLLRGLDIADKAMFAKAASAPHSREAFVTTMKLAGIYTAAASLYGGLASLFAEDLVRLAYGEKFSGFGPTLLAWVPVCLLTSVALPLVPDAIRTELEELLQYELTDPRIDVVREEAGFSSAWRHIVALVSRHAPEVRRTLGEPTPQSLEPAIGRLEPGNGVAVQVRESGEGNPLLLVNGISRRVNETSLW